MVEGARLECVYAGNRIEGSNPSPSAIAVSNFGADFMICSPDWHGDSLKEYEKTLIVRESSQTGLDFPLTKVPN